MQIETKYLVTDDYGVRGTLIFSGFTPHEITEIIDKYKDEVEKSDLGHFCNWCRLNFCSSNKKDVHVTYL